MFAKDARGGNSRILFARDDHFVGVSDVTLFFRQINGHPGGCSGLPFLYVVGCLVALWTVDVLWTVGADEVCLRFSLPGRRFSVRLLYWFCSTITPRKARHPRRDIIP